jgi:hypothetical protein
MIEGIVGLIVGFVAGWLVGNRNGRAKVEADLAAAKAHADQLLAGAPTIRTAGGGGGPIEPPRN